MQSLGEIAAVPELKLEAGRKISELGMIPGKLDIC
jgi:hypothetical protein